MSEKTLPPTAKRLREAAEKGQFPRSKLFTSAAVTVGGLGMTLGFAGETTVHLVGWTRRVLSVPELEPGAALLEGLTVLGTCAAPTFTGALAGALLSAVATTGGLQFRPGLLAPKLERLDPTESAKKLFSGRQLVDVLKGLAVAGLVAWVLWSALRGDAGSLLRAATLEGGLALPAVLAWLRGPLLQATGLLLVLGLADWALARRRHLEDLKMSHDEVKQEHRNAEGDPKHKAKRKQLHKQLATGGPARGVQAATAIVVNPTHIAVALRYAEAECDAPYIVARGREEDALKLRTQAQALGIPVIRDVPLARSLVQYDVGDAIPEELYQAAAAILSVALDAPPTAPATAREKAVTP